jgi:diadenosine tetraphosphatase ApaH/serine/threonine PP2A family protein phosphatase
VGGRQVVNPDSVGQPKDGDPQAAYAVLDTGVVRLERAAYPVEATVRALVEVGIVGEVQMALAELLQTGRVPPTLVEPAHDSPDIHRP